MSYKFTIPKQAYYQVKLPDGKEHLLLLEIGKDYSVDELREIAEQQSA